MFQPEYAAQHRDWTGPGTDNLASPAKFGEIVTDAIGKEPPIPARLEEVMRLPDRAIPMENDYNLFKDWLLANL